MEHMQQQLTSNARENLELREEENSLDREGQEYPNVESIRKRLFDSEGSTERESRDRNETDTWKRDLKEMEERILKNQIESESRIKKANMEAHDQCRIDMIELLNAEEKR